MRKDKIFKDTFKIQNGNRIADEVIKQFKYYNPDLVLEINNEVVVLEHSSTGDRKVHIGELSQFIEFTVNCKIEKEFSMILLLDGEGDNPPDVKKEAERLRYYINALFNDKLEYVNFIGVIRYDNSLSGLTLKKIKGKCECVFQKKIEYKNIEYKQCVEIVCSNIKSILREDENFIEDVVKLIEDNLEEDANFDINPNDELEEYMDYPIFAIGEVTVNKENDNGENVNKVYFLFIERHTVHDNLILNLQVGVEKGYLYSGINDEVYKLKTSIKDILSEGFKNIYWQFDEHNNSICKELYGRIHVLENEFRQLIIEFMVKSYGYQWEERLVNKVLKKKITQYSSWYKTNFEEFKDVYIDLFNLQVSDLIVFLKSVYKTERVQEETENYFKDSKVYKRLPEKGTDKITETIKIKLNDILFQNSIWNLYMVDILGQDFIEQWDEFEKIRNMVAHNKPICNKLYETFENIENLLSDRFKNFRDYITSKFDSKNKENLDMLRGKREIEIQQYEEMYRSEAGLNSMPNDEDDVFEEINENDDVIEFINVIEEYVENFKSLVDVLLGHLEDIDVECIELELRQNIIETIFNINNEEVSDEQFIEYIQGFVETITDKINSICNETEVHFGSIAELYGAWDGCIEIAVEGNICIEEGNTDELFVELKHDNNIIESGNIVKTYGEYYISDYGAAMPEVEDDLEINLDTIQTIIQERFDNTIELLSNYINIFEE